METWDTDNVNLILQWKSNYEKTRKKLIPRIIELKRSRFIFESGSAVLSVIAAAGNYIDIDCGTVLKTVIGTISMASAMLVSVVTVASYQNEISKLEKHVSILQELISNIDFQLVLSETNRTEYRKFVDYCISRTSEISIETESVQKDETE